MPFDPSWTCEDLARELCDVLVAKRLLKEDPSFIRTDREAKLIDIFKKSGLNGKKFQASTARELEVLVRQGTQGEAWVQDVIAGLSYLQPLNVSAVTVNVVLISGSQFAVTLGANENTVCQLREKVRREQLLPSGQNYNFLKANNLLNNDDVLVDDDTITAVGQESASAKAWRERNAPTQGRQRGSDSVRQCKGARSYKELLVRRLQEACSDEQRHISDSSDSSSDSSDDSSCSNTSVTAVQVAASATSSTTAVAAELAV